MEKSDATAAVERGFALLTSEMPAWRDKVNAGTLSVASIKDCPLAQIFGDYCDGIYILSGHYGGDEFTAFAVSNGFESPNIEASEYDALTREWKRLLAE